MLEPSYTSLYQQVFRVVVNDAVKTLEVIVAMAFDYLFWQKESEARIIQRACSSTNNLQAINSWIVDSPLFTEHNNGLETIE